MGKQVVEVDLSGYFGDQVVVGARELDVGLFILEPNVDTRYLNLSSPDLAYLGLKEHQQSPEDIGKRLLINQVNFINHRLEQSQLYLC